MSIERFRLFIPLPDTRHSGPGLSLPLLGRRFIWLIPGGQGGPSFSNLSESTPRHDSSPLRSCHKSQPQTGESLPANTTLKPRPPLRRTRTSDHVAQLETGAERAALQRQQEGVTNPSTTTMFWRRFSHSRQGGQSAGGVSGGGGAGGCEAGLSEPQ